jgi:hypothetical protein
LLVEWQIVWQLIKLGNKEFSDLLYKLVIMTGGQLSLEHQTVSSLLKKRNTGQELTYTLFVLTNYK